MRTKNIEQQKFTILMNSKIHQILPNPSETVIALKSLLLLCSRSQSVSLNSPPECGVCMKFLVVHTYYHELYPFNDTESELWKYAGLEPERRTREREITGNSSI